MTATVRIWDLAVRLFHWGLAASFAVAWISAEQWDDLHLWAGYAAAALVGYPLVWGIAEARGTSLETVRTQVKTVPAKTNAASRAELVRLAVIVDVPIDRPEQAG